MRRLENRIPVFFATTFQPASGFAPEPGMRVDSVSAATLGTYVLNGEFNRQQHVGALAEAATCITLA